MKLLNARQKMVTLAVASAVAGGAGLVSAPAHAINVSQNNVGQVLLYPYYTVKNGYDTLLSVVNTSDRTVVFKIRFREALNSREVRDWNVVLTPYDIWNGAVTNDGAGGALFRTFDKSCTSPLLPTSATVPGSTEVPFTNAAYSSTSPLTMTNPFRIDGGGTGIDRVQEGYFEIISMASSTQSTSASTNVVEYNAKHVSGVPRNCSAVDAAMASTTTINNNFTGWSAPQNVLKGHSTFIDVNTGKAIDAEPTALEDWVTQGTALPARLGLWSVSHNVFPAGNNQPTLADGDLITQLNWIDNGVPGTAQAPIVGGLGNSPVDGVSGLLMRDYVMNQFTASPSANLTDWIVTFPTKHHYTDSVAHQQNLADGISPFNQGFDWDLRDSDNNADGSEYEPRGKSCDTVVPTLWDREEKSKSTGTQFSPVTVDSDKLCYEANVITFNSSNLFGTGVNHKNLVTTDVGTAGWMALQLLDSGNLTEGGTPVGTTDTFSGLPVIGFAATVRNNSADGSNNRNYGASEEHAYRGGVNSGL